MSWRPGLAAIVSLLLVEGTARADEAFEKLWSATLMGDYTYVSGRVANDDIGDFFDQYDFTPNKSSSFPFELGVSQASFDLLGEGETPVVQFRLESPTSNLGVSGSQVAEPFLNQRAVLFNRFDGIQFDVEYRRMRTEELRLYPNAFPAVGPSFTDLTNPNGRFDHDRTGFEAELRVRPAQWMDDPEAASIGLNPELMLRGGYDDRGGERQFRFIVDPTNQWLALTQPLDQSVSNLGGGVFAAPGGLLTMAIDFDHVRFRQDSSTILQSDLGGVIPPNSRTIGFIPDTDQSTGTLRLNSRIGERAVLEGGFQVSQLTQTGDLTPAQQAAGLTDNSLLFYSANLSADVAVVDRVSASAFFKFEKRDNDIQRGTTLYNPTNQIAPFFGSWSRIVAGTEVVYRPWLRNLLAVGFRFDGIDRDLDFALPIPGNLFIPAANAMIADETRMYTVYGRTALRPIRGLHVRGEIGYRFAPDTGYITDLDNYVYGTFQTSYTLPIERPVTLSAFIQGGSGDNTDFTAVGQTTAVNRFFDRSDFRWGLTADTSLLKRATLYASFFQSWDDQDYDIVTSNFQRYFAGVEFAPAGTLDYRNEQWNLTIGTRIQLAKRTDCGLAYSFTDVDTTYAPGTASAETALIQNSAIIDANIHGFDFEAGHWIRDGLRVQAGYRLQIYDDFAPVPSGFGSAVPPFDPSMLQQTVTLSVTLTSDLVARGD